jgi:hypothetical protein
MLAESPLNASNCELDADSKSKVSTGLAGGVVWVGVGAGLWVTEGIGEGVCVVLGLGSAGIEGEAEPPPVLPPPGLTGGVFGVVSRVGDGIGVEIGSPVAAGVELGSDGFILGRA